MTRPAEAPTDVSRRVLVIGLVAILAVNTVLAFVLNRYVADQLVSREAELAREFLESVLAAENSSDDLFATPGPNPALDSFARHVSHLPGFLRANIYAPDLTIRHSTDPDLEGTRPEVDDELIEALAGRVISGFNAELGDAPEAKLPGFFTDRRGVIEAYLPLRSPDGVVMAVVEYYRRADSLGPVLKDIQMIVWVAAVVGGAVIFGTITIATLRASRIIATQTREIRAMAIMASLGQMAAAVAHSIRNPLASIRSTVDLMRLTGPVADNGAAEDIASEVARIDGHVAELLAYAQQGGVETVRIDLIPVLAEGVERMRPRCERRGVALTLTGDRTPIHAMLETHLFRQVLDGLITNALEAVPVGGHITVSAARSGGVVRIAVQDDGPGVPPEVLPRLPEPFLTTKVQGLGLGLSIATRFAERQGGRLMIQNRPQGGAGVTLVLPTVI
jgi:two-component system sensor histidine kinase HydH